MITQEKLFKQKKRVDFLSEKAKISYKTLMNLCNEISTAEDLSSLEDCSSEGDKLIYILSGRIIDHLTYTQSLLSAYEEYSKMLEKLISQAKLVKRQR